MTQLLQKMSEKTGISVRDIEAMIEILREEIQLANKTGASLMMPRVGSFKWEDRKERTYHLPNGTTGISPAKRVIVFRKSSKL